MFQKKLSSPRPGTFYSNSKPLPRAVGEPSFILCQKKLPLDFSSGV